MGEQTLPPAIVAYLQTQAEGRVETANDAMKQLTDRERHILREAAVMGWVRGAMAAGGGREAIPKDIAILVEVINCCRSNSDLYPKIAAAANGDLEPTWREVKLAASRAGYRVEQATLFPEGHQRWLITDKDDNHPWHATVQHSETRGWQIDLHGPYGSFNAYPPLNPGRVLAAARLLGLVGGVS